MGREKDLSGKVFENLTFIKKIDKKWEVRCSCGNVKYYLAKTFGKIKSCGCTRKNINKKNIEKAHIKLYKGKYSKLKKMYKKEYSDGDILFEDFLNLSFKNCYYCNKEPSNLCKNTNKLFGEDVYYNGLDRIDNNLGHYKNNVVPCCKYCNIMKSTYSIDNFKDWLIKINRFNFVLSESAEILKLKRIWKEVYFDITFKQFSYLSQLNCYYCGIKPGNKINNTYYNGLDRINNNLDHNINNVVPCCKRCNFAKNNRSIDEFYDHINKIKINLGL